MPRHSSWKGFDRIGLDLGFGDTSVLIMQPQDGGWLLKVKVIGRRGKRENDGLNTNMAVGVSGDAEEAASTSLGVDWMCPMRGKKG